MASRFIPNRCVIRRMRVYTGVTRGKRLVVLVGHKAHRHCRAQRVRFETKWLSQPENLAALADLAGQWVDEVHQRRPPKAIVLEMV